MHCPNTHLGSREVEFSDVQANQRKHGKPTLLCILDPGLLTDGRWYVCGTGASPRPYQTGIHIRGRGS